ncbi:MAG: helix-turn-helix transcriptional regulator [Desulfobulbaceae bacterium]|uniref:Helix-turn-helix transcriptional regulator n=1 Tax=Candidatus Desulfatifera sulfidica TaxID=2841691 RepID=A0A8J6NAS9_9BACT|nr:helix-turn-helix transcriptional regulator [Candidatus Desulfatifera sulfidica]
MSEQEKNKSGLAMVQVSGPRIRGLREGLELTQLYLATVVGVTTETISRWERSESPTIKKENGLKLAAALEVELTELLVPGVEAEKTAREGAGGQSVEEPVGPSSAEHDPETVSPVRPGPGRQSFRPLLWGLIPIVFLIVAWFLRDLSSVPQPFTLEAIRVLPTHSAPGQVFPVVIRVTADDENSSSLLIREQLPPRCVLVSSLPKALEAAEGQLKWLGREGGDVQVVYLARCETQADVQTQVSFRGSVLLRRERHQESEIVGASQLELQPFHWADQDRDQRISDEEVLDVHDDFGVAEGLGLDVDRIEEMWLGSGYRWLPEQQAFEILP